MTKKLLSLLLAVCLIVGALPLSVSAATISGNCGPEGHETDAGWTYDDSTQTLTISGKGTVEQAYAWSYTNYDNPITIKHLVIGSGITAIGETAFELTDIETCVLPNTLTSIGYQAFLGCRSLKTCTIPSSVTEIDEGAFYGCSSWESTVTWPAAQTTIPLGVFEGCSALTVIIPATVTALEEDDRGDGITWGCTGLIGVKNVQLASGNTSFVVENGALLNRGKTELYSYFAGNTQGSYAIPDGVTLIPMGFFDGITSLSYLYIPASVKYTWRSGNGFETFSECVVDCTSLETIEVAEGNSAAKSIDGMLYSKDGKKILCCPPGRTVCKVASGTTDISSQTFAAYSVDYGDWDESTGTYPDATMSLQTLILPASVINFTGSKADEYDILRGATNVVVYGVKGSTAETFAKREGLVFREFSNLTQKLTFPNARVTKNYGDGAFTNAAVNSVQDGGAVTYKSSNANVATVNTNTGEISIVGTGSATITATAAATDLYLESTASYTLTVNKAAITGYQTAAPTATILANNPNNTATDLKTAANLPANVTVTYKDGTASLPITWANATEKFNAKGGTYTFKGTVTPGTNFNAYSTPLTATLTVTPVTGTLATSLPASVVVAQSQAASAASYADFKLPSSITINCDNSVATQTITPEWSVPLNTLKAKRAGTKTIVKVTNVPAWLTMDELSVEVQVTDKFPVNVTVTQANGTYGTELTAPVASQSADGNGTDPNGTFTYKYTGKTAAGKTYNSADKPTEAGSYTVTATLVSDTHAGSGSANFTIAPKALTSAMIGAIDPVTYTGSAQTPALTVTDGKTLVKGTDYAVEYTNNINAGTATATITGKGNYTGTASKTFTIQPKDISGLTVTITGTPEVDQALLATVSGAEASGLTYAWTSDGSSVVGQTKPYLILTSAYENKQIAATVTGSGNYTGTASSQAVTVGASTNESTSVAVPAKPEVSAKARNKQISVSISVPTEETDKPVCLYEIQLCNSTGTLLNTYYSLTNSYTITGLTNRTAYQVKAIAYNVNGASTQSEAATATPKASAPSGGGSSTPTTPDPVITENPDGSTTTTETADDGTVTATTTWEDGQQAVAVKSPEGEKTITVTTAAGEKVADVNVPAAPAAGKEFEDVKSGSWYESAVDTATGYGLFNGTSETKFSPDDGMTRAMLATVLYNLSGKPEYGTDAAAFNDVETGKWYEDPVDWAYKVGVTSGTSATEFSPDDNITREQLVTMLYNYAGKIGAASKSRKAITGFPDGNNVAGYAQDAMQWAVAEGFISGRASGGKNYIAPKGTATRAEVAAVLTKFVEYLKK